MLNFINLLKMYYLLIYDMDNLYLIIMLDIMIILMM